MEVATKYASRPSEAPTSQALLTVEIHEKNRSRSSDGITTGSRGIASG